MKRLFPGFVICLVAFSVTVCSQNKLNKNQYLAIDPFDYKLDERKADMGAVRKYKSVVQFRFQNGSVFSFYSLDRRTTLDLTVTNYFASPDPAQIVTVYFTATKKIIDESILDAIDYNNTTEEGISLEKSAIFTANITKTDYREIDPSEYKTEAELAARGAVRKYKSTVLFSVQNGISYYFVNQAGGTTLSMKAERRFPFLSTDQEVTIYFTATKGIVDSLSLDDIEL